MPVPKIKHCLVCDDVRFELHSKLGVTGLYGITPDLSILVGQLALPVRLCFLFLGGPGDGEFLFRAEIRDKTGTPLPAIPVPSSVKVPITPKYTSSMVVFWFPEIKFPQAGPYTIVLFSDNEPIFSSQFGIAVA